MSSNGTISAILALVGLCAGGVVAWQLSKAPPALAQDQNQVPVNPPDSGPTRPGWMKGDAAAPKPVQNPRDISLMTKLPDGSYIPNLNGVRVPMTWHSTTGFSPIVGIRRSDLGRDWWVHENGSQSTIFIGEGTRNGIPFREPVLQVANVLPTTAPVAPAVKTKAPKIATVAPADKPKAPKRD